MPSNAQQAAAFACEVATTPSHPDYLALSSEMCWNAVSLCAHKAGAISGTDYATLKSITADSFNVFVNPLSDPVVSGPAAMRRLPQGHLLGFVEQNGTGFKLIHAMLSTGHGLAAGNKNSCIGLGSHVGWEILNLASLRWITGTNTFNAFPPSAGAATRPVSVYARSL